MRYRQIVEDLLAKADVKVNGDRPWDITVHNNDLFPVILAKGSLGLGEAYMAGWWDCAHVDQLIYRVLLAKLDQEVEQNLGLIKEALLAKLFNRQSRRRSAQVANVHYNLDNDLYQYMLGPSMAYTCGYWERADNLDQAQFDKYDLVCRKLGLKQGDQVLELGCGWGGFAAHAAQHYGCQLVAVSISREQIRYAKEHYGHLPIKYYECDYRDQGIYNPEHKKFDAVVSIGMCEHVGYKNYDHFVDLAYRQLKDHHLFLLHTIGGNGFAKTCEPWTNKYVFPNGVLPSIQGLGKAFAWKFVMEDWHNFGVDYDHTLMAWHKNFMANWDLLKDRYDEHFFRMWSYYLLTCAGMFRARGASLWQIVLSKDGLPGGYRSVR